MFVCFRVVVAVSFICNSAILCIFHKRLQMQYIPDFNTTISGLYEEAGKKAKKAEDTSDIQSDCNKISK